MAEVRYTPAMKRIALLIVSATLALGLGCRDKTASSNHPTTVVLIVRHAEKIQNAGDDPHLSEAGIARASALAAVAEHAGVNVVYVTQYQRTRETAAPLASRLSLPILPVRVTLSNPAGYLKELVGSIVSQPSGSVVLVVSHSNTVPALVNALAQVNVPPMGDADYDRIYVVTLPAGGAPRVIAAQYGCRAQ